MKRRLFIGGILAGIAIMLTMFSCKKEKTQTIYLGYDYFPNRVGHWVIYNVDSIVVNPFAPSKVDTFKYMVKEVIDSFYTDNTGTPTQVIVRYKKGMDSTKWVYQKTWTGNLTPTEALRKEDGIIYVKLTFPVKLYNSWNGGAFNSGTSSGINWNETNFQYTAVNTPATINGTTFDSTLTVLQDSELLLTDHFYYLEQYATGVGLIYRRIIDLEDATSNTIGWDPNNNWQDSLWVPQDYIYLIEQGKLTQGSVIYSQTYVSSGG